MSAERRPGRLAFLASFFIYFLPVFGPHMISLVGEILWRGTVGRGGQDREWVLANWAVVLGVQALVFVWFRFCFSFRFRFSSVSSSVSGFLGLLALPVAWITLFAALMSWIPAWRLVESDDAPEIREKGQACRLVGVWITLSGQFERALVSGPRTELLVQDANASNFWLIKVPGCASTPVPLPRNTPEQTFTPVELARGGRLLYTRVRHGQANQDYGVLIDGKSVPLEPFTNLDPSKVSQPRLTPDGSALAWIVRTPHKSGEVRIAPLGPAGLGESSHFDLDSLGLGSYEIIDETDGARELLLARNLREYLFVSAGGKVLWTLTPEPGVRPILNTVRIQPGEGATKLRNYLAWEGYRDEGRYVVQWRMGDKLVQKELPKGRSVSSADLSADGRYIAASTSPAVSIGRVDDAVVVWSSDGTEVFRKRLGRYNRAPVVFLAGNLVAYSELGEEAHGVTHVLKLW